MKCPKIICHMVSSVDGRLQSERWTPLADGLPTGRILEIYEEAAGQIAAGGWIVGRKTMATLLKGDASSGLPLIAATPRPAYVANPTPQRVAITVDPLGKLTYTRGDLWGDHLITILSEQVSDQYLERLRDIGVSYFFAGSDGADLANALSALGEKFSIDTLLLEGGGLINGGFLKADLIDEISLLIYPGLDGLSGVSSIFEYIGSGADRFPASNRSLRFMSVDALSEGFVWLRYEVERHA